MKTDVYDEELATQQSTSLTSTFDQLFLSSRRIVIVLWSTMSALKFIFSIGFWVMALTKFSGVGMMLLAPSLFWQQLSLPRLVVNAQVEFLTVNLGGSGAAAVALAYVFGMLDGSFQSQRRALLAHALYNVIACFTLVSKIGDSVGSSLASATVPGFLSLVMLLLSALSLRLEREKGTLKQQ